MICQYGALTVAADLERQQSAQKPIRSRKTRVSSSDEERTVGSSSSPFSYASTASWYSPIEKSAWPRREYALLKDGSILSASRASETADLWSWTCEWAAALFQATS